MFFFSFVAVYRDGLTDIDPSTLHSDDETAIASDEDVEEIVEEDYEVISEDVSEEEEAPPKKRYVLCPMSADYVILNPYFF